MTRIHHQIAYALAVAVLYSAAFGLVVYVLNPLQALVLPEVTNFASLVFIPHGLRVMATVVMGARAIPGLFLGALYSTHFIWGIESMALSAVIALISSTVAWMTLEGLRSTGINAYYLCRKSGLPPFRIVLLAGILCSVANSFLLGMVLEVTGNIERVTYTMAAIAIGDTVGLIACFWLARALLRFGTLRQGT